MGKVIAAVLAACAAPAPGPTVPQPVESAALGDTRVRPADGMVMVYVPAGEFAMGSDYLCRP
jgi:hypothetical protein